MNENFQLIIESLHCPGGPDSDNVHFVNSYVFVHLMANFFVLRFYHYLKNS